MERLRNRYLNVPLNGVLHPPSFSARQAASEQKGAAEAAPAVREEELTAQQWFERGYAAVDPDEELRFYGAAVRLRPDFAKAFYFRGNVCRNKGDVEGAMQDYSEAIRLKPDYADALYSRGYLRHEKGDLEGAIEDFDEVIRLKPGFMIDALINRGIVRREKGDLEGAIEDFDEVIRLKPGYAKAFYERGMVRRDQGDEEGVKKDWEEAARISQAAQYKPRDGTH
jgi:tetratricopeptide (TPR) repeat protein